MPGAAPRRRGAVPPQFRAPGAGNAHRLYGL